jgi:hypothetical protein
MTRVLFITTLHAILVSLNGVARQRFLVSANNTFVVSARRDARCRIAPWPTRPSGRQLPTRNALDPK